MTSNNVSDVEAKFISVHAISIKYTTANKTLPTHYEILEGHDMLINIDNINNIQPLSNLVRIPVYERHKYGNDLKDEYSVMFVKDINEVYIHMTYNELIKKLGNKVKLL